MTVNEAEDIARRLKDTARAMPDYDGRQLLKDAAEAIDYLLRELDDAENGYFFEEE